MAWVFSRELPFDIILYINTHLLEIKQKEKLIIDLDRKKHMISHQRYIYESPSQMSLTYKYIYEYTYLPQRMSSISYTDYESDYKRKKRQAELSKALFGHCIHLELPKQKVYKKNLSNKTINRGLKR